MPGSRSGRDAQTARDLHFRSLWHSPLRPHRRKAPETAAEPLLRDQNRSRRHSSELPQCFRTQRLDRASIQHLRAATERESHNSLHHFPVAAGIRSIKVGDLSPTRDFNYVADTCRGFIEIAKCQEAAGQEINIATGREVSMQTTLETIASLMNADVEWVTDPERLRRAGSEVFRLLGSTRKSSD